ncbi:MAG: head GIN domain-containing protein [Bacteroidota bacterium]
MKKHKSFLLIAVMAILFSSCIHHEMDGNRQLSSETRQINEFNEIKSEGNFIVNYYQSPQTELIVEAESNLLPFIQTSVEGNTLVIKTKDHRNIDNNLPITISVYGPNCKSLYLSGSGKIQSDSIFSSSLNLKISGSGDISCRVYTDNIKANISGSGDLDLAGTNSESEFQISGSGTIHSYELYQNTCFATISGSGSMFVTVEDLLDAKITGSGRIYYKGNASVNSQITGSGSIINKN